MFRAFAAALLAAFALTACASVPNALQASARQGIYVKDVAIAWTLDDAKKTGDEKYAEGKTDLQARLKSAVAGEFQTSPAGSDPVRLDVEVKGYSRVGAAMGNIIGGANAVVADVKVVRVADGSTLGVYKNVTGMFASHGGVIGAVVQAASKPDIVGIMANSFAHNLRGRFDAKA